MLLQLFNINRDYLTPGQSNGVPYLLGVLIWPFGMAVDAIRKWELPVSKNAFWLFCIFFGFTFIISDSGGADSERYATEFIQLAHSTTDLKEFTGMFYVAGSDFTDIISPLIMFFLSRITDNPLFLFVIFAVISGYFYSRNLWYVLERAKGKLSGMFLLYFLTFILINPIWNINGFRFSIAAQIFLFGTLPYLLEGKKKYLIWSGVSLLAHFTFILPVAILGLFLLLRNRIYLYLTFFVITSFLKEIDMLWFQSMFSFLPDFIFLEIGNYLDPAYAEYRGELVEELPWFLIFSARGIRWVVYIIIFSSFYFAKDLLNQRSDLKTLLSFSLLFYGFANIVGLIPSGQRFFIVGNTFMIPYFLLLLASLENLDKRFVVRYLSTPLLLLFCVVSIRVGMDYYNIMTLIGNPITVAFYKDSISLIDQLKNLL